MCGAIIWPWLNLPGDGPLVDTWCIWEHLYSTSIFSLVLTTKTRVCWKQEHFPEPPNPCWITQGCRHGSESRVIIKKPTVFWPGVEVEGMNTWTKKRELFGLKYFWKSLVKVKLTSHHKGPSRSLQQSVCWNPWDHWIPGIPYALLSPDTCRENPWHLGYEVQPRESGAGVVPTPSTGLSDMWDPLWSFSLPCLFDDGGCLGTPRNTRAPPHLSLKFCYTVDQSLILPILLRERSRV